MDITTGTSTGDVGDVRTGAAVVTAVASICPVTVASVDAAFANEIENTFGRYDRRDRHDRDDRSDRYDRHDPYAYRNYKKELCARWATEQRNDRSMKDQQGRDLHERGLRGKRLLGQLCAEHDDFVGSGYQQRKVDCGSERGKSEKDDDGRRDCKRNGKKDGKREGKKEGKKEVKKEDDSSSADSKSVASFYSSWLNVDKRSRFEDEELARRNAVCDLRKQSGSVFSVCLNPKMPLMLSFRSVGHSVSDSPSSTGKLVATTDATDFSSSDFSSSSSASNWVSSPASPAGASVPPVATAVAATVAATATVTEEVSALALSKPVRVSKFSGRSVRPFGSVEES